jgi:polyphosphate glucokinase
VTVDRLRVLVVDIGGTSVKLLATGRLKPVRIPSGPGLTPAVMIPAVVQATAGWQYDVVSIGYPGPVVGGRIAVDPVNLSPGWLGFDFAAAFDRPVRLLNDAAMQALGGYRGGRMLFLGLGTGLGTALVVEGHVQPMELGHLPYRKGRTFEEYVGGEPRKRMGTPRWREHVFDVVARLRDALQVDSLLIGGGNARRLRAWLHKLPPGTRLGSNVDAFRGGMCLWQTPEAVATVAAHRGHRG